MRGTLNHRIWFDYLIIWWLSRYVLAIIHFIPHSIPVKMRIMFWWMMFLITLLTMNSVLWSFIIFKWESLDMYFFIAWFSTALCYLVRGLCKWECIAAIQTWRGSIKSYSGWISFPRMTSCSIMSFPCSQWNTFCRKIFQIPAFLHSVVAFSLSKAVESTCNAYACITL